MNSNQRSSGSVSAIEQSDDAWGFTLHAGDREIAAFAYASVDAAREAHAAMHRAIETAVDISPAAPVEPGFFAVPIVKA